MPILIILMWAGMLWSRAMLSIGMIGFFLIAIVFHFQEGWRTIRRSIWLQGLLLLFVIPLVTVFWSEDYTQWIRSVQVKMPLLLMPFGIPLFRVMDKRTKQFLLVLLCGFILASSLYSYWFYFSTPGMNEAYLKAKVLPVAMSNDHVRYAWLLVIGYSWLLYEVVIGNMNRTMRIAGYAFLLYLAIFIHVLAAKTGLLGFYLVTLIAIFSMVPPRAKALSILAFAAIPLLAWVLLPSFQNRLKFVVWDFQNYSRGDYVEGLSDGPRVLSYKAGQSILEQHLFAGVGSGDVQKETWNWYDSNAVFLKDYERLLPSNEVLMYGCAGGLTAALACLLVLIIPFFMNGFRGKMLWLSFHLVAFAGFMYEIGLEVQHGVFLFCFFSCFFYSLLSPGSEAEAV
ncbi:MAG TPA: O-antigen ligase family protein [Chitinophagaceae bacterium]|nr:O-antigen ligase family protein [Chitinophagaceae bacterium]